MDFFEAQDRAKRNTGKLIALYALAVTGIIISIYFVTILIFVTQFNGFGGSLWNPVLLAAVTVIILILILSGTAYRVAQLRKGGSAVAELLGGQKIEPMTTDTGKRMLMNIVEEMSIASGVPVPDVYVLENEENINAFAAGFNMGDAAIGVTRGALEQLSRDELQGVIAHEYSHIFNGDMRLNIRLIGILNGILIIHIMGMILIRSVFYSGGARVRSSKDGKGGNSTIAIIVLGVALIVIGYIGMICGRMIQSAISRQREYLADAAAVQYTRNPEGLAGALNKIGLKQKGAEIKNAHSMEMSHLFFASSYHSFVDRLFSTHPPLEKRIKTIAPHYGSAKDEKLRKKISKDFGNKHVAGKQPAAASGAVSGPHPAITPEVILAAIGSIGAGGMQKAGSILKDIPPVLRNAAHQPLAAEALIYALLLKSSGNNNVPEWLNTRTGNETASETDKLLLKLENSKREWFLPLTELSFPALRKMSASQYKEFRSVLSQMLNMNRPENLFGFVLEKMIVHQLDAAFSEKKERSIRHHHLKTLGRELSVLLSALSHLTDSDPEKAWNNGLKPIEKVKPDDMEFLRQNECRLRDLDTALDELAASANPVKKYIISAVIYCVTSDKKINTDEMEMMRAVSEVLETPIPAGILEQPA